MSALLHQPFFLEPTQEKNSIERFSHAQQKQFLLCAKSLRQQKSLALLLRARLMLWINVVEIISMPLIACLSSTWAYESMEKFLTRRKKTNTF